LSKSVQKIPRQAGGSPDKYSQNLKISTIMSDIVLIRIGFMPNRARESHCRRNIRRFSAAKELDPDGFAE
jgi:hypothetical protein